METAVSSPTIPPAIAEAVARVMGDIKSLPKSEHNGHSGYDFASIDAFLAAVGPLCATAGLLVLQDEEALEIIDRGGKGWVKVTYTFTLAHSSGAVCERPMRRTVLQAIAGPQTTGATQSYALKQFMRSLFQIPTGDGEDSDAMPKDTMPVRQERAKPNGQNRPPPAPPAAPGEPQHIAIPEGAEGLQVGRWTRLALDALAAAPDRSWRLRWLALHEPELAEVARHRPAYAAKVWELGEAPDATALAA